MSNNIPPHATPATSQQGILATMQTLPTEIICNIMNSLRPREILALAQTSARIRTLALWQLNHTYDIRPQELPTTTTTAPLEAILDRVTLEREESLPANRSQLAMSALEFFVRLALTDFYEQEKVTIEEKDEKEAVVMALHHSKRILRRLYLCDKANEGWAKESPDDAAADTMPTPEEMLSTEPRRMPLNPYIRSLENLHIIARVLVDQVCKGMCLPETSVLMLQCLCSLHDQDHFQYMVRCPEKGLSLRLPPPEERASMGQLAFQYLVPVIVTLLKPPHAPKSCTTEIDIVSQESPPFFAIKSSPKYGRPSSTMSTARDMQSMTADALPSQQQLLLDSPNRVKSVDQLTRVLCFLPLLGRHFNTLPTSTFIETFLDRSRGNLPIDRAAVMVYGFMCVLDLETGMANLASESYKIFERSMPTQGVAQAQEMIRMVGRHRMLMRGFLLSSPTFSSTRLFRSATLPA